jgi:xylulose-5-phosphate/fructose-6-phosphate phosphoketolase
MTAVDVARAPSAPEDHDFSRLDAYFRAANYLAAGQIYLMDNPLLHRPLVPEDIKPRLLGHWGTSPGPQLLLRPSEPMHQGS